jgi:hypothetical protein
VNSYLSTRKSTFKKRKKRKRRSLLLVKVKHSP